ncbi:hypothetical protein C5610_05665 [Idiomarina sp. OT37-5b]|uniref:hypothetical protein n=1 Tax=Idiomarina sp. OT37-5b TaxID=2100422 RepID=UPI000CF9B8CA|nr:hypothetical protein [Idiomarina sp. OT37-5b]AVJ55847.1 hypothetical protein C5610_05665 [Idiomarina sp. OT37-5b]
MATTIHFEKLIKCQGKRDEMEVEFGRSSYYKEDSIYLKVNGKVVVMDRKTAKEFVDAVATVGVYFGLLE